MTLEQLEYNIGQIALKNNLVNAYYAGGSLYEINAEVVNEYPIIFITPAGDHTVKENTTRYSLTIYYADRLWDDDRNETDICSAAIETLKNLLRQIGYLDWVAYVQEEPVIRLFTETEKMNDRLAGAYMQVWVEVLNASTCPEFLDELGRPMGNYIPGNLNVLDAYATKAWVLMQKYADKPWVLEQIANIHLSGGTTQKQVLEMIASALTEYTKTENFATINSSAITNGGDFQLVERSEFIELLNATDVVLDYNVVSAMTVQERIDLYNAIRGYDVKRKVWFLVRRNNDAETQFVPIFGRKSNYIDFVGYSNVGMYTAIYLYSNGFIEIRELPVYTLPAASSEVRGGVKIGSGLTMVGDTLFAEVSSSVTENITVLSSVTSSLTENLSELSAFTHESVSSITNNLTTLSAVTESVVSGLSELSASTVSGFTALQDGKQDKLTAGDHIVISGATISAVLNEVYYDYATITAMTNSDRKDWAGEVFSAATEGKRVFIRQKNGDSYINFEYWQAKGGSDFTLYIYFLRTPFNFNQMYWDTHNFGYRVGRTTGIWESANFNAIPASTSRKGMVQIGNGLSVTNQGVLSTQYQVWVGTQAQYDALANYDSMTFYVITGLN